MYRKPEVRSIGSAQERILGPGGDFIEDNSSSTPDINSAETFQECLDQDLLGPKYVSGDCVQ